MTKNFVCLCRQLIYGSLNDLKSSVILTPSLSAAGIKAQSWQNAQSKWLPKNVLPSLSTCPGFSVVLWSFKPQEKHLAAFSVHRNFSVAAGKLPGQWTLYCTFSTFWAFCFLCLSWQSPDNLQPFMFKFGVSHSVFYCCVKCENEFLSILLIYYWCSTGFWVSSPGQCFPWLTLWLMVIPAHSQPQLHIFKYYWVILLYKPCKRMLLMCLKDKTATRGKNFLCLKCQYEPFAEPPGFLLCSCCFYISNIFATRVLAFVIDPSFRVFLLLWGIQCWCDAGKMLRSPTAFPRSCRQGGVCLEMLFASSLVKSHRTMSADISCNSIFVRTN